MSPEFDGMVCPRGVSDLLSPDIISVIRERQRRMASISRYDRYIAQAADQRTLQEFWRKLRRQEMENARWLKDWLAREVLEAH